MEKNQIIRIPIKYWELINTMSDEDCGKLMKCIFEWKDCCLEWVTQVYYNIIMTDVINLYNASNNWKKGGRPKKETTGNENKKPGVMKKENQGLWKTVTNTKQNKVKQYNIKQDNSNNILDSKEVELSKEIIATEVATLENYIKNEFSLDFITEVYNKYWMTKEDFQEECNCFLQYWKETSPNWKKERWEKEKTFDPKLRFRTWMKNNKKWSKREKYEDHENVISVFW